MERIKVVSRYRDGKVLKGFTQNFFPNKDRFHLFPADKPSGPALEVFVKDLKAVFVVKDFEGNSKYTERKFFAAEDKPQGRKVEVTFQDGEVMVGSTLGFDLNRIGFFLFPADPQCNNIRVFAVSSCVKKARQLQ